MSDRYSDISAAMAGVVEDSIPKKYEARLEVLRELRAEILSNPPDSASSLELDHLNSFLKQLTEDHFSEFESTVPRGLSLLLGSRVWPIFYTAHFAILNFLAGNPLIIKPSETVSKQVLALITCFRKIEALRSIQLIVGDKEMGRRLSTHEKVSTILFQGTFEVGMRVSQDALSMPWKQVLLYLGSKNPAIVFADAKSSAEAILVKDALFQSGQHCRSVSIIFVERPRLQSFVQNFKKEACEIELEIPLEEKAIVDRYLKFIAVSEREGAEMALKGKTSLNDRENKCRVMPTLAVFDSMTPDQIKKSVSIQTEIFLPHMSVIGFDREDELLSLTDLLNHGRLASLWTGDSNRAKNVSHRLKVGEVCLNQSVFDFNSYLSRQAYGRSGNHAMLGKGLLSQLLIKKIEPIF